MPRFYNNTFVTAASWMNIQHLGENAFLWVTLVWPDAIMQRMQTQLTYYIWTKKDYFLKFGKIILLKRDFKWSMNLKLHTADRRAKSHLFIVM